MSKIRQEAPKAPSPSALHERDAFVRTASTRYFGPYEIPPHAHDWDQIIDACEGVLTVHAAGGAWVVPPHRAAWLPAGIRHAVRTPGGAAIRSVYFKRGRVRGMPRECRVLHVSPLLHELIREVCRIGMLDRRNASHRRLAALIADQLQVVDALPMKLPMPAAGRAGEVAAHLRAHLETATPQTAVDSVPGAGRRTIEREFLAQTGLSLGRWWRQARMLRALERLSAGISVTETALDVGYATPSAFIAAFKTTFGAPPRHFVVERAQTPT